MCGWGDLNRDVYVDVTWHIVSTSRKIREIVALYAQRSTSRLVFVARVDVRT